MSKDNAVPLWYAMTRLAIQSITLELGEKYWQRFIEAAKTSNVPVEFLDAFRNKRGTFSGVATSLFKTTFRNEEERVYAVIYANAIAAVKSLLNMEETLSVVLGKLNRAKEVQRINENLVHACAFRFGCTVDVLTRNGVCTEREIEMIKQIPNTAMEIENTEREIEDLAGRVQTVKKMAQSSCGAVIQLENYGHPPPIKYFGQWLLWFLKRMFGRKATTKDLVHVSEWVETFFSDRRNRVSIMLLSRGQ